MFITLFFIGLLSGMITGLLSVGGGIILIFLLMFIPPIFLKTNLSMHTIAGFSIMQAVFSTLSGGIYYIRNKLVDFKIVYIVGIPSMFGGVLGVLIADITSEFVLKTIFATLSILSAIIMQIPYSSVEKSKPFSFTPLSTILSILVSLLIGVLGGLVGLGAGFIFVPLLIFAYRLPIKKAIGSSLITCFLLSFGSLITKLSVDEIPFAEGILLIVGGIIGAQIGGRLAKIMKSITLKKFAAYSILLISVRLFYDLFQ
jgi:uncharacterized protein